MPTMPPHRKKLRRFETIRQLHELTFSSYRRESLLTTEPRLKALSSSLQQACEAEGFDLAAFVFMPDHVHLLVWPRDADSRIARLLARTKQPASKAIKDMLLREQSPLIDRLTVQERPGKTCFRFWQEGAGFDRNLFSPKAIEASIDYLHANPVRRGLCIHPTDWKWSSARWYVDRVVDPDLPPLKVNAEWFDTSDVAHSPT
jgi:putative transposase